MHAYGCLPGLRSREQAGTLWLPCFRLLLGETHLLLQSSQSLPSSRYALLRVK